MIPIDGTDQSEFLWARLAMAFDCEGSIAIGRQKSIRYRRGYTYFANICITNTSEVFIDWLADTFGFCVYRHKYTNNRHRDMLQVKADRQIARNILVGIRPYLIIKGEQADLAMELQDSIAEVSRRGQPLPEEVLDYREGLWARAKELNRKGK